MRLANGIFGVALALALRVPGAWGQTMPASAPAKPDSGILQTFYFTNVSQPSDANEIFTAVRNLSSTDVRIAFLLGQNALSVRGTPEQLLLAQKIVNDLDRPKKTYRLAYTLTEMEGGKRIGVQHFAMIVVTGGKTTLKNGSRVPIVTGAYNPGSTTQNSQVTYLDVGLNIDASLDDLPTGARLRSKVGQSSVAEEKSGVGAQDPIVRQTLLEGTALLTPGKPAMLGSLDVPGSTRHLDVEVVMEAVR